MSLPSKGFMSRWGNWLDHTLFCGAIVKTAIAYVLVAAITFFAACVCYAPLYRAVSGVFSAVGDAFPRSYVQRSHE